MTATSSSPLWSPCIAALEPYVPGEQPRIANLVKLNTNEHPMAPSARAVEAIAHAAREGLQRYPDPESTALREAIAAQHGLAPGQVFVGNGSDEVLAHAFFAFLQHPGPLLFPDVTYTFYRTWAQLYGITAHMVPVDDGLRIDVAALAAQAAQGCAGIVLANPNAPTGIGLPLADIERLLAAVPGRVVLVDEAYVGFGGHSAAALVKRHPNLLVVQTLSKSYALAGLRVGFALGASPLVEALARVKNSFNSYPLDRLAQAGALAAVQDEAWLTRACAQVVQTRETLAQSLGGLGFTVLPSQANFLFVRHPAHDAGVLAAALRARAILVRHFRQPRIDQWLRISIGSEAQCATLMDALGAVLRERA
jgi:histidinol-phosphate aminotransferase